MVNVRLRLKCDGTRAETRFRLSAKWSSFKSAGASVRLSAELCASAVVMLDTPCTEVVWRVLAAHSIRQFPLHSPPVSHRVPSCFNCPLPPGTNTATCFGLPRQAESVAVFVPVGNTVYTQWPTWKLGHAHHQAPLSCATGRNAWNWTSRAPYVYRQLLVTVCGMLRRSHAVSMETYCFYAVTQTAALHY